ncbi:hypothetical protein OG339_35710 [Streptosporangium sp. NBC_01495]|uniref:hypothetical protein n=1 Tax=Streptosporangium sp. NBC_01495 TaxID=2903899 RepID=UPI002E35516D|nr:hypothetical protein [Streptosporangium sp. NBC_01495]
MAGLLDGAVALLDRRQLTSVWLPLTAFLAALAAIAATGAGWDTTLSWWNALAAETRVLTGLAVVMITALAGQLLSAARPAILRCYEGHWPDLRIIRPMRNGLLVRHLAAQRERRPQDPELFLGYPRAAGRTLPTRLGNILRAAEEHGDRYGLDAVSAWPRLYAVLPDPFRTSFAQAASALETAVTVSFLGGVFAVVGGALGTLFLSGVGAVGCVWGGALVALIGYRAAVRAARPYGHLVRAAFDVHRFLLLEAMRLRLPTGPAQERAQWQQLGKVWYRGAADFDQARALRYPAEEERPAPAEHRAAPRLPAPDPVVPPVTGLRRVRAVLGAAVVLAGVLSGLAAEHLPVGPEFPYAGVRAGADLAAFHTLTENDLRRARGQDDVAGLLGRYTLRPVSRGDVLRPGDLGPRLGTGLRGRMVMAVPVSAGADRVRRGQSVNVRAASGSFTNVLVLDVQAAQTLIVAVPTADTDRLSDAVAGGPARLILTPG